MNLLETAEEQRDRNCQCYVRLDYTSDIVFNILKVKVPILVIERKGPELIPDCRQSACR